MHFKGLDLYTHDSTSSIAAPSFCIYSENVNLRGSTFAFEAAGFIYTSHTSSNVAPLFCIYGDN